MLIWWMVYLGFGGGW